jgi:hypothetical protein
MANADVFAKMRPPTREKFSSMAPGTKNEPMVAMPQVEDQKVVPYTATELPVVSEPPRNPSGPAATAPIRAKGSGGYVYDVMPDNSIRIIQSSRGKGGQIVTEDSEFYDLIMDDIKKMNPEGSASPEGDTKVLDLETTYIPAPKSSGTPARIDYKQKPSDVQVEPAAAISEDAARVWARLTEQGVPGADAARHVRLMDKASIMEAASQAKLRPDAATARDMPNVMANYEDALLSL